MAISNPLIKSIIRIVYWVSSIAEQFHALFHIVGLSTILFIFSVAGGWVFKTVEAPIEDKTIKDIINRRTTTLENFYTKIKAGERGRVIELIVQEYEFVYIRAITQGVVVESGINAPLWTLVGSIYYCVTTYTLVGFGNLAPRTNLGRLIAIFYAGVSIPVATLILGEIGEFCENFLRGFYAFLRRMFIDRARRRTNVNDYSYNNNVDGGSSDEECGTKMGDPSSETNQFVDDCYIDKHKCFQRERPLCFHTDGTAGNFLRRRMLCSGAKPNEEGMFDAISHRANSKFGIRPPGANSEFNVGYPRVNNDFDVRFPLRSMDCDVRSCDVNSISSVRKKSPMCSYNTPGSARLQEYKTVKGKTSKTGNNTPLLPSKPITNFFIMSPFRYLFIGNMLRKSLHRLRDILECEMKEAEESDEEQDISEDNENEACIDSVNRQQHLPKQDVKSGRQPDITLSSGDLNDFETKLVRPEVLTRTKRSASQLHGHGRKRVTDSDNETDNREERMSVSLQGARSDESVDSSSEACASKESDYTSSFSKISKYRCWLNFSNNKNKDSSKKKTPDKKGGPASNKKPPKDVKPPSGSKKQPDKKPADKKSKPEEKSGDKKAKGNNKGSDSKQGSFKSSVSERMKSTDNILPQEENKEEEQPPMMVVIFVTCIYIVAMAVGMTLWLQKEKYDYVASIWFIYISIATIGYGDIVPNEEDLFLILCIFMFVGLSLASTVQNEIQSYFSNNISKARNVGYEVAQIILATKAVNQAKKQKFRARARWDFVRRTVWKKNLPPHIVDESRWYKSQIFSKERDLIRRAYMIYFHRPACPVTETVSGSTVEGTLTLGESADLGLISLPSEAEATSVGKLKETSSESLTTRIKSPYIRFLELLLNGSLTWWQRLKRWCIRAFYWCREKLFQIPAPPPPPPNTQRVMVTKHGFFFA